MIRIVSSALIACMLLPCTAVAAEPVSRREGFLVLWQSVRRPAQASREKPYEDVRKGERGFEEITYAKARGILDDDDPLFRPGKPLTVEDALLWLFRTRSVGDIATLTTENLPSILDVYPLGDFFEEIGDSGNRRIRERSVSEEELTSLMRALDGLLAAEVHEVSLYAEKFHGKGTAFGEAFDMHALTAAHRTYPGNTLVEVTNVANEQTVIVRINDRGPFVNRREMDLSLAAFIAIADRRLGKIQATFRRLGDATLIWACDGEPPFQERVTRQTRLKPGIPHILALGQSLDVSSDHPFVVRSVLYPDGGGSRLEDWVNPGERFAFTPSVTGLYRFVIGDLLGRRREMRMRVIDCRR